MDKKIILISGGSDGLGKSIAAKLSPNNLVIILSHNQEKLQKVAGELKCDYVVADVTDFDSLEKAVGIILSKYKKIDVLINNAGIWVEGQLDANDAQKIAEIVSVNTLGTIFLTKAVLPSMRSTGQGRIINIISQDGLIAKKDHSVYSASKWAITGFTKCLQEDLSHEGINVTGIYPGLMNTGLFEKQGVSRNLTASLDPVEVASLIEFVINLTKDILLPDISIKNINNPNTMDDTNSPQIGLDINPDLITPQTGIPKATGPVLQPVAPGVIDITPGKPDESHQSKVEDITPKGPGSIPENPAEIATEPAGLTAAPATPVVQSSEPAATAQEPVAASTKGVIDITPSVSTTSESSVSSPSAETSVVDSGSHLTDVLPVQPSTPASDAPSVSPSITTQAEPVVASSTLDATLAKEDETVTPTQTPAIEDRAGIKVELPPAVPNALQEDPDLVKLSK